MSIELDHNGMRVPASDQMYAYPKGALKPKRKKSYYGTVLRLRLTHDPCAERLKANEYTLEEVEAYAMEGINFFTNENL